jgi:group I intron endonuclease
MVELSIMYLVYAIYNIKHDKVYIGQTIRTDLRLRWYEHISRANNSITNIPIYNAIRKYGEENFIIEQLCECSTQNLLDAWEKIYIERFNSSNKYFGYNVQLGGNGHGKHSEKTKKKIGDSHRGRKFSEKHKKNMSLSRIVDTPTSKARGIPGLRLS